MLYTSWKDVPKELWPYRNFTPKNIASKGDGSILIDDAALSLLDELFERFKVLGTKLPWILSAYRDPLHNARVGGAPLSVHKLGRAFDLATTIDFPQERIVELAKETGFLGIGRYPKKHFVHVDTFKRRNWNG